MNKNPSLRLTAALLVCLLPAACSTSPSRSVSKEAAMIEPQRETVHRGSDDLLTAGLGLDGLRVMTPPAFADVANPTAEELRRRAMWNNWRGIADLSLTGGYGQAYGSVANVPGREFSAFATVDGAKQPHRVLVQVPDNFDQKKRCVVVTAASAKAGGVITRSPSSPRPAVSRSSLPRWAVSRCGSIIAASFDTLRLAVVLQAAGNRQASRTAVRRRDGVLFMPAR